MSVNAKQIIEVLINHGQVQLSKHNIDVITQKVLNIKPLNVVLVGRDRQCSIQDLNLLIFPWQKAAMNFFLLPHSSQWENLT